MKQVFEVLDVNKGYECVAWIDNEQDWKDFITNYPHSELRKNSYTEKEGYAHYVWFVK